MASQWLVDQSPQGGCEKSLSGFAMQSSPDFGPTPMPSLPCQRKVSLMRVSAGLVKKGTKIDDVNRRFDPYKIGGKKISKETVETS